jgi:hypothetical protein
MASIMDELKERNILTLIWILRFARATLDVGHPITFVRAEGVSIFMYSKGSILTLTFASHSEDSRLWSPRFPGYRPSLQRNTEVGKPGRSPNSASLFRFFFRRCDWACCSAKIIITYDSWDIARIGAARFIRFIRGLFLSMHGCSDQVDSISPGRTSSDIGSLQDQINRILMRKGNEQLTAGLKSSE